MTQIIPFPDRLRAAPRLTVRDRVALFRWEAMEQAAGRIGRIVLHEDVACDEPELVDFALFYRPGESWAAWGIRRGVRGVSIWRCGDGSEEGPFATAEDALAVLRDWVAAPRIARPRAGARPAAAPRAPALPAIDQGRIVPFAARVVDVSTITPP
jgi:hypothetical protein